MVDIGYGMVDVYRMCTLYSDSSHWNRLKVLNLDY